MSKQNEQTNPETGEVVYFVDFNPPAVDLKAVPHGLQEVLDELSPSGAAIKAEDLIDQVVTVHYMKPFKGTFGPALWCVLTTANGELFNTVFGGTVLCEKLWTARERLPLRFTLVTRSSSFANPYYDAE